MRENRSTPAAAAESFLGLIRTRLCPECFTSREARALLQAQFPGAGYGAQTLLGELKRRRQIGFDPRSQSYHIMGQNT